MSGGDGTGTVQPPFHAPRIADAEERKAGAPADNVQRAAEWAQRHPGHDIGSSPDGPWFRAAGPDGEILDTDPDLGTLVTRLEDEEQRADEADLATLRRWHGRDWSITYDASRRDGRRWEAMPRYNVGRPGGAVTASTPDLLAYRLAERGLR